MLSHCEGYRRIRQAKLPKLSGGVHPEPHHLQGSFRHSNLASKWTHPFVPSEKVFNLPNKPLQNSSTLPIGRIKVCPFGHRAFGCITLSQLMSKIRNFRIKQIKGKFPLDHHGLITIHSNWSAMKISDMHTMHFPQKSWTLNFRRRIYNIWMII